MGIFDSVLGARESLITNEDALDYEYIPKLMPYREAQQKYVATCIRPLFDKKNGKNLFVFGAPGIGKTAAIRHVLREMEEKTDDIFPLYINCWQKNTTYKIFVSLCDQLGYKFTQNKKTEELFDVLKNICNKKSTVFVFDEIDKSEEFDFLYSLIEEIYSKTILLITNYRDWITELDPRIRSRLVPDMLEFKAYTRDEIQGIIKERINFSFVPGIWTPDALKLVVDKTHHAADIRSGLFLLRESALAAEAKASKHILLEHAEIAAGKLDAFSIKKKEELEDETRTVLELCKQNDGNKIGELFALYQSHGGGASYKTFQRKVEKLAENKFISVTKTSGGKEGNTTIVHYSPMKRLSEY